MPLSAENEVIVRRWVGDEDLISTAALDTLYDQFGTYDEVVLHVLRQRQVELVSQPSSLTVPGLSITNTTNIAELRELIDDFMEAGGTGLDGDASVVPAAFKVTHLVRPDLR